MFASLRAPSGRLAAAAVIAALFVLVWTTVLDIRSGTSRVEQVMQAQATSIADLVAESAAHGLTSYRRWEDEVAARLNDNARWLARRDAIRPLTDKELEAFARIHGLGRINVFDRTGEKVATSRVEAEEDLPPKHDPRDFIGPILRGEREALRIGFKPARFHGGSRFAVAVARANGGAIVVNVFADSLQAVLAQIRPEHLLETLRSAQGVRYARIEAEDSVLAALVFSPDRATEPGEPSSPSSPARPDRAPSREWGDGTSAVYEVARTVNWPGEGRVTVRVGLDRSPLDRARADLRLRAWARAAVLLIVMALAALMLLTWQGRRVLEHETGRLRIELAAREQEAHRSARLTAMGELAAHVAHEIRNPLNTIHMNAQQLARDAALDPAVRLAAEDMRSGTGRIEEIVRQFLEVARPRRPRNESLDLGECAESLGRAARAGFDAAGISLEVVTRSARAQADPALLGEIVDNLLRNAREAVSAGGRVRLETYTHGTEALLVVQDDGPGVPEPLRERVFDLYYTTKPEGTGLGLSLVSQMANVMGGGVRLESPATGGARFVVHFPREGSPT